MADIDGDGALDLVVGNRNASTVSLCRSRRRRASSSAHLWCGQEQVRSGCGRRQRRRQSRYSDDERAPEHRDRPTGHDDTVEPGQIVSVGPAATFVAIADFNGDGGWTVTTNSDGDCVSVSLGNGDGTFSVQQVFAVGRSPRRVLAADVSGDGTPDLIVANYRTTP